MRFSLSSFFLAPLVLASILSATVLPNSEFALIKRKGIAKLDAGDVITCGTGISLNQHDCNVAFLKLGGGIAGKIQFLRVNTAVTTGVSGTCQFTAQAIDGGTILSASKGRLEHGQEPMLAQCKTRVGSTVKIIGGTNNGGNVLLTISEAPVAGAPAPPAKGPATFKAPKPTSGCQA